MTTRWWTLDKALTLIGSTALVTLFLPMGAYLTRNLSATAEQGLASRAYGVVRALAPQLVEPILWEDHLAVHEILERAASADSETRYLYVEYANGKDVDGLPNDSCPPDLIRLWKANRNSVIRLRTRQGPIVDVAAPILGGQLGFLHMGLSRSRATQSLSRMRWALGLGLSLAILVVFAGACIISTQVSKPLHRLESMVSRFPQHPLGNEDLKISRIPELNSLGRGFQDMARRLEALQREQAATQVAMVRAERLATVGELSAGLAHEICNPLDGILECLRYLEADPEKSPRAAKYYPMLRDGFQRIGSVMGGMLTFARSGQKVTPKPYALSQLLENLKLLLLSGQKSQGIRFEWHCQDDCLCLCEPQGLAQASLNLILNAKEAAAQSSEPEVKICAACNDEWVCLSVEDSGPGVPEELRERIFDAFFTTKPVGKGTGLGLSVSRQLIRAVGGELELLPERSSLGGAKFIIRLPKVQKTGAHNE